MPLNFSKLFIKNKEVEFEKGISARAVEKYRNKKPSPQLLCINAVDHFGEKVRKGACAEPPTFTYAVKSGCASSRAVTLAKRGAAL